MIYPSIAARLNAPMLENSADVGKTPSDKAAYSLVTNSTSPVKNAVCRDFQMSFQLIERNFAFIFVLVGLTMIRINLIHRIVD